MYEEKWAGIGKDILQIGAVFSRKIKKIQKIIKRNISHLGVNSLN
jgi:hypothetical protein